MSTSPCKRVGHIIAGAKAVEALGVAVKEHPLLGLQKAPFYATVVASMLPDGHDFVKAIGVWLEQGQSIPEHQHDEWTTLWYPAGSETPLMVGEKAMRPEMGAVFRLDPDTPHSVPEVVEAGGRLSIAVLSVAKR